MSYRDVLRHRDFRLLFSGQLLSQLGDAVYEIGIVWLVFTLSHSSAALGWLAFCQSVPFLIFGLVAGAYADRLDRRKTMIASDLARGLAVAYLLVRYWLGGLQAWEVCAVAAVLTTARAFFHPAMRALLPQMMPREQLLFANSLSESGKRICKIGGMMLGGLLMATGRADAVLAVNAASFFLSLATVWFIRSRSAAAPKSEQPRRSLLRDIRGAFGEVARTGSVRFSILLSSAGLLLSAGLIKVGLPLLAGVVLEKGSDAYGLLMACFSVGMFCSAALMKRLSSVPVPALVKIGWSLYGLTFLGLAFGPPLVLACLMCGLTGFAHFLTDIPVTTLIQQKMPMARMSACQSIWATASFGSESASVALTGAVLGLLTLPVAFTAAGGTLFAIGLASLIKFRKKGQVSLDRRTLSE